MCRSEKNMFTFSARGFSLIEMMAALVILAVIMTSVVVIMNRCAEATIDGMTKMEAFAQARENMENLLAQDSVEEMVEYGISEKNDAILWETVVENFYEPITNRMWVRAICSASYTDSKSQEQTVELTHWLTSLTRQQILQILEQQRLEAEYLNDFEAMQEDFDFASAFVGKEIKFVNELDNIESGIAETVDTSYGYVMVVVDELLVSPYDIVQVKDAGLWLDVADAIDKGIIEVQEVGSKQPDESDYDDDPYGLGAPPAGFPDWDDVSTEKIMDMISDKSRL